MRNRGEKQERRELMLGELEYLHAYEIDQELYWEDEVNEALYCARCGPCPKCKESND